jgi:nicotinamidase/pyrazinamidase
MPTAQTHLLLIDPQNDFCDLPPGYLPTDPLNLGASLAPSLPVPGAHADMQRLARFIDAAAASLAAITVTLDSHHRLDIAHPGFWQQADGKPPEPFTPISAAAVRAKAFLPRDPAGLPRCLAYLDALETAGRYQLMIWPVHCELGSWGHAVHADVRAAYNRWEAASLHSVSKVLKGMNRWTEHYSALQAEVPDPQDPASQLNQPLLDALLGALGPRDRLLIAGEASSHCVRATVEHLLEFGAVQGLSDRFERLVLLTDCMSPVSGFEAQQQSFFAAMQARGLRLSTSQALLAESGLSA